MVRHSRGAHLHAEAKDNLKHGEKHQHQEDPAENYSKYSLYFCQFFLHFWGNGFFQVVSVSSFDNFEDAHDDYYDENKAYSDVKIRKKLLLFSQSNETIRKSVNVLVIAAQNIVVTVAVPQHPNNGV